MREGAVVEGVAEATPASDIAPACVAEPSAMAVVLPVSKPPTSKVWSHRDNMKNRWENGLITLLKILSDKEIKTRAKIWHKSSQAVNCENASEYEALQDPIKTRELYLGWAQGSYGKIIKQTWEVLSDTNVLDYLGLTTSAASAKEAKELKADKALYAGDKVISTMLFDTVFEVNRFRMRTHAHYKTSLPGKLVLLAGSEDQKREGLAFCRRAFKAMIGLEKERHNYIHVSRLFSDCAPFYSLPVRELLFLEAGVHFLVVLPDVERMAETIFELGSSLACELAGKRMRSAVKDAENRQLSDYR